MPGEKIGPMSNGRMEMRVQRHDAHEQGHLTPEGKEHAAEVAEQVVREYLDKNPDTHFLVINSDQMIDQAEPEFGGRRAQETGELVIGAIRKTLQERGLPAEQLFGFEDQDPSTITPVIREADIFDNGFMKHLRDTYPDDNEWRLYYQDADQDERLERHAESADSLAQRMDYMIKTAEMAASSFHKTPGKEDTPLLVWMVGHGGGLDAYVYKYADVPLEELGFPLSGGFTLRANEKGEVVAEVKGKDYTLNTSEELELPQ